MMSEVLRHTRANVAGDIAKTRGRIRKKVADLHMEMAELARLETLAALSGVTEVDHEERPEVLKDPAISQAGAPAPATPASPSEAES